MDCEKPRIKLAPLSKDTRAVVTDVMPTRQAMLRPSLQASKAGVVRAESSLLCVEPREEPAV